MAISKNQYFFFHPIKSFSHWLGHFTTNINNEGQNKRSAIAKRTGQTVTKTPVQKTPDEQIPDVLLDLPTLKVDALKLNVDDLDARVALHAELANFVKIDIGIQANMSKIDLDLKGLDAQAILKVRLKQVWTIFSRALDTIDQNPELLRNLLQPVGDAINTAVKKSSADTEKTSGFQLSGNGKPLHPIKANGAQGVMAQEGVVNESIRNTSKNANESVEAHRNITAKEVRKMKKIIK